MGRAADLRYSPRRADEVAPASFLSHSACHSSDRREPVAHTQTAVRRPATPPAETQMLARRLGPLRCRRDHRLERDRRRDPVHAAAGRGQRAESLALPRDLGRRRPARVCRRDGVCRARRAPAARRWRVCVPARGVRPSRRVPDRLDVVCRRLFGCHRGQRCRPRLLRRALRARGERRDAAPRYPRSVRAPDDLAPGHRRARRHRPDGLGPYSRRRTGALRDERACRR